MIRGRGPAPRRHSKRVAARFAGATRKLIFALFSVALFAVLFAQTVQAQVKPLATIELDCRASAISSQGLTACVQFRQLHFHKYTIERDNIWTVTLKGKRREIVDGQRLVQTTTPFSFHMSRIAFSPDGKLITVQMTTRQITGADNNAQINRMTDLIDTNGKEIPVAGTKTSVILDAEQATWLADDQTVAYLLPSEETNLLYQIGLTHPKEGKGGPIFKGHLFTAVAWDAARSSAVAIERDRLFEQPIKLVRLDLIHQTDTLLTTLPAYIGGLVLSPDGERVAYYKDGDTVEIRSLATPQQFVDVHCAYGTLAWGNRADRILVKRGPQNQNGDLVWISIPGGNFTPILHDLFYSGFAISPEAHAIVVTVPGDNHLAVYHLSE